MQRQREQAWQTLDRLDALRCEIEALTAETADLVVARADVSLVPVDREALAQQIEKAGAFVEQIESTLAANRARLTELCSKPIPQDTL